MAGDEKIAAAFLQKRPDVAARLLESMDIRQATEVLEASSASISATVLNRMLPNTSARCAEQLSAATVAELLEQLPLLSGAALLRHLSNPTRDNVLRQVSSPRAAALKMLLRYPANAVGAWMDPGVLTFSSDYSVREAADLLEQSENSEHRIYVVDRDRRPCGAVRGLTLLRGSPNGDLQSIIEPIETIWARESVQSAQSRECWERSQEAPVVNRQGEFVGRVTFSDLIKGQRNTGRSQSIEASDESLTELAELFWHGIDGVWNSVTDVVHPQLPRNSGE